MSRIPFPSNQNSMPDEAGAELLEKAKPPWKRVGANEPPLTMFQVHFNDGRVVGYAYCDLREWRLRDAGHLQLCIFGFEKYQVNIEGRHLKELADLIGTGKIKSFAELGNRTFEIPEAHPAIDRITVDILLN